MDFSFDDDQLAIRELAYQIFTDRATDEFLLNFSRTDDTYDEELWQTLAQQGLLGISAPESVGGSGLGFTELCLILEEQGRRVAPVPLYASLVLGGLPIQQFGTPEQQQQWLTVLVSGQTKFTAAIAELGMNAGHGPLRRTAARVSAGASPAATAPGGHKPRRRRPPLRHSHQRGRHRQNSPRRRDL